MNKKNTIKVTAGVIAFLLFGILYLNFNYRQDSQGDTAEFFAEDEAAQPKDENVALSGQQAEVAGGIYVHICGEVKNPGVYQFVKEPRVLDVIEKAGGFTKKADQSAVNLAESVSDGTQLTIQAKEKKKKQKATDEEANSGRVNINTASKEELLTLSGIGESKATQILSYRESNGGFQKIEDIMNITGIKEGVFNKIKDYITV